MTRRRELLVAVVASLALLSSACGGDEGTGDGPPADSAGSAATEFGREYDASLADLGFRVGRAGFTEDATSEEYREGGRHLAVYVEPIRELSDEEYVEGVALVARLFLPDVFEEYPDLASFDVCQEPRSSDDDPKPRTQIALNREQASRVDWSSATTADLLRGSRATPNTVNLFVDDELRASPAWAAIEAEVGAPG